MLGKLRGALQPQAKTPVPREVAEAERRVRGRGSREPDNWRRLAEACARARDLTGAFAARREVAKLLPDDFAPAFECGIAARKADAIPEALDWFSRERRGGRPPADGPGARYAQGTGGGA